MRLAPTLLLMASLVSRASGAEPPLSQAVAARAEKWLESAANADGGFGYRAAGISYTAPTAVAVLALAPGTTRSRAIEWLEGQQLGGGAWPVTAGDPEPSWMTSAAVAALAHVPGEEARVALGRKWLAERCTAFRKPDEPAAGWPWTPGTAPWVEPTAWALVALAGTSDSGPAVHKRVRDAVGYLVGEMNREGGWSLYEARPYPYHTSLVLLAFDGLSLADSQAQGRAAGEAKARAFLAEAARTTTSIQDLSWALWALSTGIPELSALAAGFSRLAERQEADGSWGQSPWLTASSVVAYRALLGHDPLNERSGASGK